MKNVMILTASFGMGHKSVAQAVKEQIEDSNIDANSEIVDILEILNPSLKLVSSKFYEMLTEDMPIIYNKIYDIKKCKKNNIFDGVVCSTYYKKFYNYIKLKNPDVVISTFPLCSCIMSRIKKNYQYDVKLVTIITDIVDSWEWIYDATDEYLVASEEIRQKLVLKGVDYSNIEVTGIPVKSRFMNSRKGYSYDKNLLIIANGMNEHELSDDFIEKLDKIDGCRTIIVTGRNKLFYERLSKKTYSNITVLGFVDYIDKLMDNAMLIVTKPGGITVFEAINKELPLVIKDTNIGQEKGNIDFIRKNNLGVVIKNNDDLFNVINEYMNNPKKTKNISENISKIKKKFKPERVVKCILS